MFLMEKYFEGVRQDEKHVPDLLESIMRPKLFVKEELRLINDPIWIPNRKNQGFNFLDSGNLTDSRRRPMPAFPLLDFKLSLPDPINQKTSNLTKTCLIASDINLSTFWMSGNLTDSRRRPMPACLPVIFKHPRPVFCNTWPC